MSYEEILEMLPEFVLGTLDSAEMLAVDAAIAADPRLALELRLVEDALAAMAMVKEATPPPPHVREKLMAQVTPHAKPKLAPPPMRPTRTVRTNTTRSSWWERLFGKSAGGWQLATGLAMLVMAFSLMSMNRLRSTVTQLEAEMGTLSAELSQSQADLSTLQIQNDSLQQQLEQERNSLQLAASPERFLALDDTGITDAPISGTFFQRNDEVLLVASNLPPAPAGQAYYLWGVVITEDGEKIFNNLGEVPLDANGDTTLLIDNVQIADGFEEFMVIDVSLETQSDPRPPILEGDILLRGGSVP